MKNTLVWTAIVTPMFEDGKIDFTSFEKLLRSQEAAGNGVVLLGSTGEGMALGRADKEAVLKFAQTLNLKVPTISGLPGHQQEEVLDFIRFAKTTDVKGFLAVTPYYAKPGVEGQTAWFNAILDEAGLPVMLYNVPSRAAARLQPQVIVNLKDHPNLWSLKESSGSIDSFNEYKAANPNITMLCGDDGLMPAFAKAGAKGLVSVASNVWPVATRKMAELSIAGKADEFLPMWEKCADSLFLASNPVPTKWLHFHLGEIKTASLRAPLTAKDLSAESQAEIKANHAALQTWLKERESL